MHAHMCTYIHACTHTCTRTYIHACTRTRTHACTRTAAPGYTRLLLPGPLHRLFPGPGPPLPWIVTRPSLVTEVSALMDPRGLSSSVPVPGTPAPSDSPRGDDTVLCMSEAPSVVDTDGGCGSRQQSALSTERWGRPRPPPRNHEASPLHEESLPPKPPCSLSYVSLAGTQWLTSPRPDTGHGQREGWGFLPREQSPPGRASGYREDPPGSHESGTWR